jgi:Spy/CpxP family protein refolding chaperone
MKNKLADIIVVLVVVGFIVGIAAYTVSKANNPQNRGYEQAQGQGRGSSENWRRAKESFMEQLSLTSEQKEKMLEQAEDANDPEDPGSFAAKMEQFMGKLQALNALINEPSTALTDVSGLIAEVNTAQKELLLSRTEDLFAIKKILTPEQFSKYMTITSNVAKAHFAKFVDKD